MFGSTREAIEAGIDKAKGTVKEFSKDQAVMSLEKAIDTLDEAVRLIKARNLGYSISAHLSLGPISFTVTIPDGTPVSH